MSRTSWHHPGNRGAVRYNIPAKFDRRGNGRTIVGNSRAIHVQEKFQEGCPCSISQTLRSQFCVAETIPAALREHTRWTRWRIPPGLHRKVASHESPRSGQRGRCRRRRVGLSYSSCRNSLSSARLGAGRSCPPSPPFSHETSCPLESRQAWRRSRFPTRCCQSGAAPSAILAGRDLKGADTDLRRWGCERGRVRRQGVGPERAFRCIREWPGTRRPRQRDPSVGSVSFARHCGENVFLWQDSAAGRSGRHALSSPVPPTGSAE